MKFGMWNQIKYIKYVCVPDRTFDVLDGMSTFVWGVYEFIYVLHKVKSAPQ